MKVTHDFHIHTHLSLCAPDKTGTISAYVESAKRQGLKKLGFADHFWGLAQGDPEYFKTVRMSPGEYYKTQNFEYVSKILPELEAVKDSGIKTHFGCEAEYDPFAKGIAITPSQAEQFDFIIVPNSHTHMMMPKSLYEPYNAHIDFMFDAFYDIINCDLGKYVTAVAHPFRAICCPYGKDKLFELIPKDRFRFAFDAAAQKGIAIEINVCSISADGLKNLPEYESEYEMFLTAKECGCKFTFGSDAHTLSGHEHYSDCDKLADILGITENDIADIAKQTS